MDKCVNRKYGHCCYEIIDDQAWIYNLYIFSDYRRLGYGSKLLKHIIKKLDGYQINIQASPEEDSISLIDLTNWYKRLGLNVVGGNSE